MGRVPARARSSRRCDWSRGSTRRCRGPRPRRVPVPAARPSGTDGTPAETIVRYHMDKLQNRRFKELAEVLALDPGGSAGRDRDHPRARSAPRPEVQRREAALRRSRRLRGEDRRRIPDRAQRGRPAAPAHQPGLPAHGRARGAETAADAKEYVRNKLRSAFRLIKSLEERQRTIYKVARVDRQVPELVPRLRHRASAAARAQGRGRRHRDARVDGQPRGQQQVHAHPSRRVRDAILLPQRDRRPRAARRTCRR